MDNEVLETLARLEKYNRQQASAAKFQCIISVISMICCTAALVMMMLLVPKLQKMTIQTEKFISEAGNVMEDIQAASATITELDLGPVLVEIKGLLQNVDGLLTNVDTLVADVDTLVTTTQAGLEDTLAEIEKVDFDTLNKAIKDLAAVVEPLAKFFSNFSR